MQRFRATSKFLPHLLARRISPPSSRLVLTERPRLGITVSPSWLGLPKGTYSSS